jgi:hypothetical protein
MSAACDDRPGDGTFAACRGPEVVVGDDDNDAINRKNKEGQPAQEQAQPVPRPPRHCERCGGALEPGTIISRLGEQPAYQVSVCAVCGFVGWVKV